MLINVYNYLEPFQKKIPKSLCLRSTIEKNFGFFKKVFILDRIFDEFSYFAGSKLLRSRRYEVPGMFLKKSL